MTVSSKELGGLADAFKLKFNRCLEPRMACENRAIRAHSIQNRNVLDLIATDDHVVMLREIFSKQKVDIDFKSVGRNEASTFTGLCSLHDTELFAPIDTKLLDFENREQLFLLAYRSVCRELHTEIEKSIKFQSVYKSSVEQGRDTGDNSNFAGTVAVDFMEMAHQTYLYRAENFDLHILENNFDTIKHDIIEISHLKPILAVSSLFACNEVKNEDDIVRCVLNVFPINCNRSVAIFSYNELDQKKSRTSLQRVFESSGTYQTYELSKLILSRSENFIISPAHFNTWSLNKISCIRAAFLNSDEMPDHQDLMLF